MIYSMVDETGQLLSVVSVPDEEHLASNTPAGATAIEGEPPSYSAYYAAGAWLTKPAPPSPYSTWDAVGKVWVDPATLVPAQSGQCNALAAAYAADIVGPITFTTAAGITQSYQADPQSLNNATFAMLGCQASQAVPAGFCWLAADNTPVPFTYADLQGLAAAMFARGQPAFVRLQALKAQVRAATTLAQVEAVTWS